MRARNMRRISAMAAALLLSAAVTACSKAQDGGENTAANPSATTQAKNSDTTSPANKNEPSGAAATTGASVLDTSNMFSGRDLEQSPDLTGSIEVALTSGQDVTLTDEGVYVLSGQAQDVTVVVEAAEDAKVQLVLDGVSITNDDAPAIYVKEADKVFVTTLNSENTMEVTGSYAADGETHLDAVIFSRADLTMNGTGNLTIVSKEGNGVSSKDDLKVTGGVYSIESAEDALEANDSIRIKEGTLAINAGKDALHSEHDEDATLGNIYIAGGNLTITAGDDGIQGNSVVQIDGGTIDIKNSVEGIESTFIQINGGKITLYASDDGINASQKVDSNIRIEVNGGTIDVTVGSGDTDGFDSNGDLYINGGTISVQANSAFDADGTVQLNGGDVTVNGEKITEITQTGPGGGRGFGGGRGQGGGGGVGGGRGMR